jgi:hypothetical protein
MNQVKAVFICGQHTNGIFVLHFTYGRRHVGLRNVVLLRWDILISRRNGIHVEYLKSHTCYSVDHSLPSSLCCYRFKRAVSKLRICPLLPGSMVPVIRNTQICDIHFFMNSVVCSCDETRPMHNVNIELWHRIFRRHEVSTFLIDVSMPVHKPRI